jgi:hypothetical protein
MMSAFTPKADIAQSRSRRERLVCNCGESPFAFKRPRYAGTKNTSRIFEIDSDAKEIVANFRCLRHRSAYPKRVAELDICSDVKIFDPRRPILCERQARRSTQRWWMMYLEWSRRPLSSRWQTRE